MRIGHGYDVHKLVSDRDLIIGGCRIPFDKGLLGHSDADVLIHAVMDAMLGACALGDIGLHFPDSDDRYKGISSIELLKKTNALIGKAGYSISNIDATIVAQAPKMRPYIDEMKRNISSALDIGEDMVNVKATTEEGLGFTGDGSGIAAHAVCLVNKI